MNQLSTLGFAGEQSGLFTIEEIDQLMRIEFERAQRYTYSVASLIVQIDRLDQVHTAYGYESVQHIVEQVVELVKSETRSADLLGYVIDGRLIVLLPHTGAKAGKSLAARLVSEARRLNFHTGHGSIRITLSVGLSHNEDHQQLSFETLRRVAEEGLSVADAGGGDRWAETELYGLYERQHTNLVAVEPTPAPEAAAGDLGYRSKLEEMVSQGGNLERAVAELVEDIMARAVTEAREEMATRPHPLDETHKQKYEREIDLLQRRIGKLTDSLGLTEAELARVRSATPTESGLASEFRQVQGLDMQDAQSELKKELMSAIFQANLDLHQRSAG